MRKTSKGKWIWANTPIKTDEYVTFYDSFFYASGKVMMDISISGDYLLYINDKIVSFGQ